MDFFADVILRSAFAHNPVIGGFAELLSQQQVTGGDVNSNTNGFAVSGSQTYDLSYITTDHNDGAGCIKILNTYAGSNNITIYLEYASGNQYWPVSPSLNYNLKAHVKSNEDVITDAYLRIGWYTSAKGFISYSNGSQTSNPTSWTEITNLGTAPATAAYAKLIISKTANENGYVLADTFSFKRSS